MASVGVVKDGKVRYVKYAVPMADQAEAMKASLAASSGEATIVNSGLCAADLKGLGLKVGDLVPMYDDRNDPLCRARGGLSKRVALRQLVRGAASNDRQH
ncbi:MULTISPECIES: hypothetical protein [Bradyrhizobium]|jgi:hypothetical protein|uniref:hypothetical protein n=1 Tax=Bradyrhizobium TaxID=374 RepID=UPI00056E6BB8|nr:MULTISPECIES: hypothetical protein [Bradyrhizobium]MCP1975530.1 hypothetical protein [Bradyrhizobium elkanii]MCS3482294.1 hypothetical protein [Bradyrhizobium elkanii]MCS3525019.1 hypothetical protein [Bradyrhizobium elkanii]MCS4075768.1 hypothetical protein [Bradyrhizobium elkanii]MCS4084982.1 hypothetical protein [Bradyrhizobium elkanii]